MDVHHTLFRNADESTGLFDTGEHVFYHRTTFIHHKSRLNAVGNEIINNINSTLSVDFFTAGESKVDIIFGFEAFADQMVGSR